MSNTSSGSMTSNSTATDRLKNTVIEPFSFELRDKALMQRREVQIKKVYFTRLFLLGRGRSFFECLPCFSFTTTIFGSFESVYSFTYHKLRFVN